MNADVGMRLPSGMGMLFDDRERTDLSIKRNETTFEFVDRSAKPECLIARRVLNDAFAAIPEQCRPEVIARLKSDREHYSVVAELYAFTIFGESGFEVIFQPELKTRSKPDLLLKRGDDPPIAVDVTVSNGIDSLNKSESRVLKVLNDVEDRLELYGFCFGVREVEPAKENPSIKRMVQRIHDLAKSIKVEELPETLSHAREYEIEEPASGWKLTLTAVRLREPAMKARSPLGYRMKGATFSNSFEMIRDKVAEKSSQHSDLGMPLVVFLAFNDLMTMPFHDELQHALYGTTRETFHIDGSRTMSRLIDGLWKPDKHRPLAVVTASHVYPWTFEKREVIFWANPTEESQKLREQWKWASEGPPDDFGNTEERPSTPILPDEDWM